MAAAINRADEAWIATTLTDLARSKPVLAPLALAIGGVTMIFAGLRILLSNWRLTLIQLLPAMWVWAAMYDLRLHLLHDKSLPQLRGAILVPIFALIIAGTIASYFLNAAFAFAVAQPEQPPSVRRAMQEARERLRTIVAWGAAVGAALAVATTIVTRAKPPWFTLTLGIVIGVLMVTYIAVPARMLGVQRPRSRRDRLSISAVSAALGVVVSAPPYLLGRVGLLMLGSPVFFVPGIVFVAVGFFLQVGATGAVKAIKVSANLTGGRGGGAQAVGPRRTDSPE